MLQLSDIDDAMQAELFSRTEITYSNTADRDGAYISIQSALMRQRSLGNSSTGRLSPRVQSPQLTPLFLQLAYHPSRPPTHCLFHMRQEAQ